MPIDVPKYREERDRLSDFCSEALNAGGTKRGADSERLVLSALEWLCRLLNEERARGKKFFTENSSNGSLEEPDTPCKTYYASEAFECLQSFLEEEKVFEDAANIAKSTSTSFQVKTAAYRLLALSGFHNEHMCQIIVVELKVLELLTTDVREVLGLGTSGFEGTGFDIVCQSFLGRALQLVNVIAAWAVSLHTQLIQNTRLVEAVIHAAKSKTCGHLTQAFAVATIGSLAFNVSECKATLIACGAWDALSLHDTLHAIDEEGTAKVFKFSSGNTITTDVREVLPSARVTQHATGIMPESFFDEIQVNAVYFRAALGLACLSDDKAFQSEPLEKSRRLIVLTLKALEARLQGEDFMKLCYPPWKLCLALSRLAINDSNKLLIAQEGGIPLLYKAIKDHKRPLCQTFGLHALCHLAVEVRLESGEQLPLKSMDKPMKIICALPGIKDFLQKLKLRLQTNEESIISKCDGQKNVMQETIRGGGMRHAALERSISIPPPQLSMGDLHNNCALLLRLLQEREVLSSQSIDITSKTKPTYDIMLSYSWSYQTLILRIYDGLLKLGYKVWLDKENMHGNMLECMAEAITHASVVIVALSASYQNSVNCRHEAEYAHKWRKNIVPIQVEDGFQCSGWLSFILTETLYIRFAGCDFDDAMTSLDNELKAVGAHPCRERFIENNGTEKRLSASNTYEVAPQDSISLADQKKFCGGEIVASFDLQRGPMLLATSGLFLAGLGIFFHGLASFAMVSKHRVQ